MSQPEVVEAGVFVLGMCGDPGAGAPPIWMARLDHKVIVIKSSDDAILALARFNHLGATFDNLAHMPHEARVRSKA